MVIKGGVLDHLRGGGEELIRFEEYVLQSFKSFTGHKYGNKELEPQLINHEAAGEDEITGLLQGRAGAHSDEGRAAEMTGLIQGRDGAQSDEGRAAYFVQGEMWGPGPNRDKRAGNNTSPSGLMCGLQQAGPHQPAENRSSLAPKEDGLFRPHLAFGYIMPTQPIIHNAGSGTDAEEDPEEDPVEIIESLSPVMAEDVPTGLPVTSTDIITDAQNPGTAIGVGAAYKRHRGPKIRHTSRKSTLLNRGQNQGLIGTITGKRNGEALEDESNDRKKRAFLGEPENDTFPAEVVEQPRQQK